MFFTHFSFGLLIFSISLYMGEISHLSVIRVAIFFQFVVRHSGNPHAEVVYLHIV